MDSEWIAKDIALAVSASQVASGEAACPYPAVASGEAYSCRCPVAAWAEEAFPAEVAFAGRIFLAPRAKQVAAT